MHLQPCDRCGATNKRSAKNCYKCAAGFTLPAPAPDLDGAPEIPVDQLADPALDDATVATERAPVPPDAAPVPPEPQPADETVAAETGATAPAPRRSWRVAALTALLAAIVMAVYYYAEQPAQLAKTRGEQSATQLTPDVSSAPASTDTPTSSVAPPLEAASVATGTAPKLAVGASGPGTVPTVCSQQERVLGLCK